MRRHLRPCGRHFGRLGGPLPRNTANSLRDRRNHPEVDQSRSRGAQRFLNNCSKLLWQATLEHLVRAARLNPRDVTANSARYGPSFTSFGLFGPTLLPHRPNLEGKWPAFAKRGQQAPKLALDCGELAEVALDCQSTSGWCATLSRERSPGAALSSLGCPQSLPDLRSGRGFQGARKGGLGETLQDRCRKRRSSSSGRARTRTLALHWRTSQTRCRRSEWHSHGMYAHCLCSCGAAGRKSCRVTGRRPGAYAGNYGASAGDSVMSQQLVGAALLCPVLSHRLAHMRCLSKPLPRWGGLVHGKSHAQRQCESDALCQ